MAKLEWGTKRTCQSCGDRFYDLRRSPIVCPKCGSVFESQVMGRGKRGRPALNAKANEPDLKLIDNIDLDDDFDDILEGDDDLMDDADSLETGIDTSKDHSDLDDEI